MLKPFNLFLYSLLLFALLLSCNKDEEINNVIKKEKVFFKGSVQKGPFVSGSKMTIQEIDLATLFPNGNIYITTTTNDFGNYRLESEIGTDFIEIIAEGYYYNEVSGTIAESPLTLYAIVHRSPSVSGNVNILTTLARDRTKYLILNEKKSFEDAKKQAEQELLRVFGIEDVNLENFETFDLTGNTIQDAVLIAISSILQCNNSVGQLSELIGKINLDLEKDGTLDSSLQTVIRKNSAALNVPTIRANLEKRYSDLGLKIEVPFYEEYLDSDGDGIINKLDFDNKDVLVLGVAQKGPFANGSSIQIIESSVSSDEKLVYTTNTSNYLGEFAITTKVNTPYFKIVVEGNYFNEKTNSNSDASVRLNAFVQKNSDTTLVNVNILTTLVEKRLKHLMLNEQKSFKVAQEQAENEVLNVFGITKSFPEHFENLDITKNRLGDQILIAISFYFLPTPEKPFYPDNIINSIKIDLELDGKADAKGIIALAKGLDYSAAKANLIQKYNQEGKIIEIGPFERYLDSDADGIINKEDSETLMLTETSAAPWREGSNCVPFNNKLWLLGNEIWSSADGVSWSLDKTLPNWEAGRWLFENIVVNNKLWLFGGRVGKMEQTYPSTVWNSSNGVDWELVEENVVWTSRDSFNPIFFNGKAWIIAGTGPTSANWNSSDMIQWNNVNNSPEYVYRHDPGCVVLNNEIFLFGGYKNAIENSEIWSSADGINWINRNRHTPFLAANASKSVFYQNKIWVVTSYGEIWSSSNGLDWAKETLYVAAGFGSSDYSITVFKNKIYLIPHTHQSIHILESKTQLDW